MKRQLSLKVSLALAVLLLGIVIVVGYSLLSVNFFFRGLDSMIAAGMEDTLETYVENVPAPQRQKLQKFSGYNISPLWQQQPEKIQQAFSSTPKAAGRIQKHITADWFQRPDSVRFVILLNAGQQPFFVSRTINRDNASPLIGRQMRENKQLIISVSLAITATLALIIWLLIRRVSQPVSRLTEWTHQLTPERLREPAPDFSYPELNEMAELIRNSLSSVHDTLEREQQFLRYTSHELRTPISVVRNNIELMRKIQQKNGDALCDKQAEIIDRIDRASLTMQHLSETLLWLSREDNSTLSAQTFSLDAQVNELVDDMRYLLNNKPVEVELSVSPFTLKQSQVATRIVVGNLIRNAFQHTWEGKVHIRLSGSLLTIENDLISDDTDSGDSEQGFGLGLQLTEQLCDKLGWHYHIEQPAGKHRVELSIRELQSNKLAQ